MAPKKRTAIEISDNATETSNLESINKIEKPLRKNAKVKKNGTRAPSSYVLFSMDYRKIVKKDSPDLNLGEISKKCGEKWKDLTDDDKQKWKDESDKIKSERAPIASTNEAEIKKKRKPSSYLCFSMDLRKKIVEAEPHLSLGEVSKRCGEEWKKMTVEEKEEWKKKAME